MEQREACKSFEKVLVQNIQFGLSPSLTEAIKSISRFGRELRFASNALSAPQMASHFGRSAACDALLRGSAVRPPSGHLR
jgi:hypothetical protein